MLMLPLRAARIVAALLPLAAAVTPARAQVNIQPFADFDFDLNPPGARAAAMGGLFVPIADDATAVEANPAGLTNLLRPEFSFEYSFVETDRHVAKEAGGGDGGHEFVNASSGPAFTSAVLPVGRFTAAAFLSTLVHMEGTSYGRGFGELDTVAGITRPVVTPFTNDLSLRVMNYGAGLGFTIVPGLALGVAGGLSRLELELDHARYIVQRFEPGFRDAQVTIDGGDGEADGAFFSVGLLARAGEVASFGAVYNARPRFDDVVMHVGTVTDTTFSFAYNIPDSFTGGFAIRFAELTTFGGEATFQRYSELTSDFVDFFSTVEKSSEDFRADDGVDLKLGVEHIFFLSELPVALRAGFASIAPSGIYYTGISDGTRALFGTSPGDRSTVYSVGVGVAQVIGRMNLDVGARFGSDRREVSTSIVYRFE